MSYLFTQSKINWGLKIKSGNEQSCKKPKGEKNTKIKKHKNKKGEKTKCQIIST